MTAREIRRRMPNASEAFIKRNAEDCNDSQAPSPKSKRPFCHEPLGKAAGKEEDSGRVRVRVISFRTRLIDPDNLAPKYFIDCLRYAGFIRDDRAQDIILEVSQEKVQSKADECTRIEIEPIQSVPSFAEPASEMTRPQLVEAMWANCRRSWNRLAFNVFVQTLSDSDLRQYIQMGTT